MNANFDKLTVPAMRALALAFVLLAAASAAQNSAQQPPQSTHTNAQKTGFIFWNISRHSVDFLLQNVPQTTPLRLAQLKQTFTDLQCQGEHLTEQPLTEGKNLLCTLPGTASTTPSVKPAATSSTGTILFLAHYEHEGAGQSVIDNWTGAIMLPLLYHALVAEPRNHTFIFAEVDGEAGARALFHSFTPDERHAIKGVVTLDALGLGPAQFYIDPNDIYANLGWAFLSQQLRQAAADQRLPQPLAAIPGNWQKIDDTLEFRHHGIPSILIHSINFRTRDLPGSVRDTPSAIDHNIYFNTFVLLAYYAAELDQPWPSTIQSAASTPSRGRR